MFRVLAVSWFVHLCNVDVLVNESFTFKIAETLMSHEMQVCAGFQWVTNATGTVGKWTSRMSGKITTIYLSIYFGRYIQLGILSWQNNYNFPFHVVCLYIVWYSCFITFIILSCFMFRVQSVQLFYGGISQYSFGLFLLSWYGMVQVFLNLNTGIMWNISILNAYLQYLLVIQ